MSMLKLNNDFYVVTNSYGYELHQMRRENKCPDIVIGYFGSLSATLDGYVKANVRQHVQDTSTDLNQVRELLKKLRDEISRVNA